MGENITSFTLGGGGNKEAGEFLKQASVGDVQDAHGVQVHKAECGLGQRMVMRSGEEKMAMEVVSIHVSLYLAAKKREIQIDVDLSRSNFNCRMEVWTGPFSPSGPPSYMTGHSHWLPSQSGRCRVICHPVPLPSTPLSRAPQLTLTLWPTTLWPNSLCNVLVKSM